jgi:anti-sigma regulatory factor (Ser/Thr protein kinase)
MTLHEYAQFSAAVDELSRMLLWIRKHLTHAKMDHRASQKVELAAEEAILNVIRYAYQEKGGKIELTFRELTQGIEITILDHGPPFDPLTEAPSPDRSSPLEKRKEGGLGVFLMRACVDDLRYKREGQANILTLSKHFSQKK